MTSKETTHSLLDPTQFTEVPVLDGETLAVLKSLEKPGDAVSFLNDLIDTFIRETPDTLKALIEAAKGENAILLKHTAHQLKGLASNIGVTRLSALAEWVEAEAEAARFPKAPELGILLETYRKEAIERLKSEWKS